MKKSIYHISEMDCASEENLIRMKLQDYPGIAKLEFDLFGRTLKVYHNRNTEELTQQLVSLNLGAKLMETVVNTDNIFVSETEDWQQRRLLWVVLTVNFGFFLIEIIAGFFSESMGLFADSLDMLADALVYGMSLMAVGAVVSRKKKVAHISGYLQILLALMGLMEVVRRFIGFETVPEFKTIIIVSLLALVANSFCLWLLQRSKSDDAHIRASVIFSSNDIIINVGVIVSGLFVWWLDSAIPDLIIGTLVFMLVLRGAARILKLAQ